MCSVKGFELELSFFPEHGDFEPWETVLFCTSEATLQRQQFVSHVLDKRLKLFQPPCREIIVAMPFKSEICELAEESSLPIGHERSDKFSERNVVCGKTA